MKLNKEDILMAELELSGTCNLECPLCVRSNPDFSNFVKPNIRKLEEIISQLEEYPNLRNMCIAGIMSEPTHYPYLIQLINYLENRNILTEVYVNGSTKNDEFWENFGKSISPKTKVIFTICGSTQELHEKYRVNSNLENVYKHAAAFRKCNNKNDYVQLIKFNYNEHDICLNKDLIVRDFSNVIEINSLPYQERFNINSDIKMTLKLSEMYDRLQRASLQRLTKSKLSCKSIQTKFISIDQFGKIYPCFLYKLYSKNKTFNLDYTDILCNKSDFCFECEKITAKLIEINGLERMA